MTSFAGFSMPLSLTIGLSAINNKPTCITSACDYEMTVSINNDLIITAYDYQHYLKYQQCQLLTDRVIISSFEITDSFTDSVIQVLPINGSVSEGEINICSFQVWLQRNQKLAKMHFKQINSTLSFYLVSKARFVKNQRLQKVISSTHQDSGLLSMDNSGRILLQSKKCNFPIIGLWQKNDLPLNHLSTYSLITSYLLKQYPNKCKFVTENIDYIYFVRVLSYKPVPQLYLISWQQRTPIQSIFTLNLLQNQPTLQFNSKGNQPQDQLCLQFTLRSTQTKQLQQLIDFSSCSPIKLMSKQQLQEILQKQQTDSPRFQQIDQRDTLQQQCQSLKQIVSRQAQQINLLKAELLRMQYLRFASKSKISISSKSKSSAESYEQNIFTSSRKTVKKLTESDLNTNSPSLKDQKTTAGSSASGPDSIQTFRHARDVIMNFQQKQESNDQRDPWEYLQIVQQ